MRVFIALVAVLATALIGGALAPAAGAADHRAVVTPGCPMTSMFRNDDDSTGLVPIGFTIDFFGQSYSQLYVNNNGNVTFDFALSTFTPFPLTSTNRKIIAPFFGDVDTRNLGSAVVTYGQCTFDGRPAFFADWAGVGVGYYNQRVDKLNIFQLILVDRSDLGSGDFDIVFNYDQIQWETGDASGGSGGIGGSPARVGFSNGINTSFEMPGSGTSMAFLDSNLATGLIWNGLNSGGELGRYRFAVRNGQIPSGHEISGGVFQGSVAPGNGVAGAFVEVCSTTGFCNLTTTSVSGGYSVPGLEDGTYNVRAFPPGDLNPGQIGPLTIAGSNLQNQDIVVTGPTPPPPGTSIDDDTPPGQIPSVVVGQMVHLETTGCDGGDATYTVTGEYGGSISGSMTEGPPGTYSADFAIPFTGPAIVTIVIDGCPTIEFNIYIDPSGFVRTPGGSPVEGATVTLFRSDTGLPGTFVQVPDGSAIMSPANRSNPDLTDATGHFGWDTIAGYYKVRAEKADCHAPGDPSQLFVETGVLPVPPPVIDIDLRLEGPGCAGDVLPPVITVPADITAEATGPDGAVVSYAASAEDEVDGPVDVSCAPASGSQFSLGTTVVSCTAEDAAGNAAEATFSVNVVDTTAPAITVPADITVDATSPAGAVVTYGASASDIVDGDVVPACSPASGDTFAIGDTTVSCTAEDAAGNSSEASFVVHVRGAAEQVADLIVASTGVGPGTSLADKARQVQAYLDAGQVEDACGVLNAYLNELRAQTGKKVTAAQAADLKARVDQIRAVLDC